jgi:hypothetical protein
MGAISYGDTVLLDRGDVQLSYRDQEASSVKASDSKRRESHIDVEGQPVSSAYRTVEWRIRERYKKGKVRSKQWRWIKEMEVISSPLADLNTSTPCIEEGEEEEDASDDLDILPVTMKKTMTEI